MKPLQSAARILALLALAGTAQAAQPPCTDADFEKFSLYDAAAMNTRIPAQELRRVFSEQFGLEMGALNHLHARCNYALSARFGLQGVWMSYPVVFSVMLALQSAFYLLVWRYRGIERLV